VTRDVPTVPSSIAGQKESAVPERFDFDHGLDLAPCVVCREPCVPRRIADGVPLHPACEHLLSSL
jgi:hypothetical protein